MTMRSNNPSKLNRFDLVASYTLTSLRLKPDRWMKMIESGNPKALILKWLDTAEQRCLFFAVNSMGELMPFLSLPTRGNSTQRTGGKFIFFVKQRYVTIDVENFRNDVIFGDIPGDMAQNFPFLFSEVFLALLKCPFNQKTWPESVLMDIETHVHNLQNSFVEVDGSVAIWRILPATMNTQLIVKMATDIQERKSTPFIDLSTKNMLEGVMIKLITQIHKYLNEPLPSPLKVMPEAEISFWNLRLSNLESAYRQLCSPCIKAVAFVLENGNSVYSNAFHAALKDVVFALHESRDITLYLNPLLQQTSELSEICFINSGPLIRPLVHVIYLVSTNSKFYSTSKRLTMLLRAFCNLLTTRAMDGLEISTLFQNDPDEGSEKISKTIQVIKEFKEQLLEYREKDASGEVESGHQPKLLFRPPDVFVRLDVLLTQLADLEHIFSIAECFKSLEKVEFGGVHGKILTDQLIKIKSEFDEVFDKLATRSIDLFSIPDNQATFKQITGNFLHRTASLEKKLATLLAKAFGECANVEQYIKLLQMSDKLVNLPLVRRDILLIVSHMFSLCKDELLQVEVDLRIVVGGKACLLDRQLPPIAARIQYIRRLKDRARNLMKIELLERTLHISVQDFEIITIKCNKLNDDLDVLEKDILSDWFKSVEDNLLSDLNRKVLIKSKNEFKENFSQLLDSSMREVKCLSNMGIELPQPLTEFHLQRQEIWIRKVHLMQLCEWFNLIAGETPECEYNLIESEMHLIEECLDEIAGKLTWSDFDSNSVNNVFTRLKSVNSRLSTARQRIDSLLLEIRSWLHKPFYCRNLSSGGLLAIEDRQKWTAAANENCLKTRHQVEETIIQNFALLRNENDNSENDSNDDVPSGYNQKESSLYETYKEYVNKIIQEEITQAIQTSLNYIKAQMDSSKEHDWPLFEVKLILDYGRVSFIPSFDPDACEGFFEIILQLIRDILQVIHAAPGSEERNLDSTTLETMHNELRGIGVEECVRSIMEHTKSAMNKASEWALTFQKYSFLWERDMEEVLGSKIDECNSLDDSVASRSQHILPRLLEHVKSQVDCYMELFEEAENIDDACTFEGWLLVNAKTAKHDLLNTICKQANIFKECLKQQIKECLTALEKFVANGLRTLNASIEKEDFDKLCEIMHVMEQLQMQGTNVENIFKPMKESAAFLNMCSASLPDKMIRLIDELPSQWRLIKNTADRTSYRISSALGYQRDVTSKQIILLTCRLENYRRNFIDLPIFSFPCSDAYQKSDQIFAELWEFCCEMEILERSARLFQVPLPNAVNLKNSLKDLNYIKQVWDFAYAIESCIDHWKATPWMQIDTEEVENECKKFFKELRSLDKNVRTFQPYIHTEQNLRNLTAALRTTAQLQNKAVSERHWMDLIRATKLHKEQPIQCLMSYKTNPLATFHQLLALNLHSFEEEVTNIVDKAVKELAVSNILADIECKWVNVEFEYEPHDRRDIHLPKVSEEFIENLEESQLQLQIASSSKHTEYIMPQIKRWQNRLLSIDQLITLWLEVQRKWVYLENIFVGSEDLCIQIPQGSSPFEDIDQDFANMIKEMVTARKMLRIIENKELFDNLQELLDDLNKCEKALNNYLEMKRLAFPRFYFLSSADLLDILSNGSNPALVERHLTKLFDSLAGLHFELNTKVAVTMISKENHEQVSFYEPCNCSGKVEDWLQRLILCMKNTLRMLFEAALAEYNDKTCEQWLMDWPAQVALCCEQIKWTSSVNHAFVLQQEGYENAMKEYYRKQISQLNALITLLLGDLSPGSRQKIMTICTIAVHCRDVVLKIIQARVEGVSSFQWQSQLRHRWNENVRECFANICDAEFIYAYEYLGNTTRLVVTPLTDRCYITLTQSLRLVLGGAPAGPAGTGKTETIKDLGRALGVMVYVFNCSEQMDYKSCGNIYKGLAQTGAWGCFDEFNRISAEVLSVIAIQVKTIQDAIKARKTEFTFMDSTIRLEPSVGIFVTMNPGYAGRTELPENLKSLFRPCAMFVADFALICEIMLVAEGFQEARFLARKFITLYDLCRELLSKQDHYDWGLRAIKSVLVVAGSLKRNDASLPENQVLMRALRDFNVPKLVTEDVLIFRGLVNDIFPMPDVPRRRFSELEEVIRQAATTLKLQAQEGFILKVTQLQELLDVRHSLFIVGSAGSGKTRIWQTLFTAYKLQQLKPHYDVLNPKAVSNDELFGCVNATTREWKDGLLSVIMRDQVNMNGSGPKWIVLDGDIDPIWIESLNTVMDDNKVLTLANNERITLKREMRLLFEVGHLEAATPATVSRAGVLYINRQDLGWLPYVSSWLESRGNLVERGFLLVLFEKYIPVIIPKLGSFQHIAPITDIAFIQMVCHLLECFLDNAHPPENDVEQFYETLFNFALIWGTGSSLLQDHLIDWQKEFHKWYTTEFKAIRFPAKGTVFDYCIDLQTIQFSPWCKLVPTFEMDNEKPLTNVIIPTPETTKHIFFLQLLISKGYPVLLMGNSGSGKNSILRLLFNNFHDKLTVQKTHFNFYTSAEMFQRILDTPLEKISGRSFGPRRNKNLLYFINDLNMAEVDAYGTTQPHTIIRQYMDYRQWYDKTKLMLKDIKNCQFAACMNPTAGSFTIDPRLQRHFFVFAVNHSNDDVLCNIYSSIFTHHIENPLYNFTKEVKAIAPTLVLAGIALHRRIENTFLPTAIKFHYIFNLRDMTNIFQGLLLSRPSSCPKPNDLIRFYVHEAHRVYRDRFLESNDIKSFNTIIRDTFKKYVDEFDEEFVFAEPLVFCHFAQSLLDQKYMVVKSWSQLLEILVEAQKGYSESIGYMNLVLFEDAIKHICRINRILESPHGNALLIGVGGSGKQALSRLAAFISSLTTFQIQLKRGYSLQDMRTDIAELYMKVGIKNVWTMFLLSDSHILDEAHLTFISDIFASGEIPDLFNDDQIDSIMNGVRNELKQMNSSDDQESCYKFFIEKVRRMLKIVLCFSPAGATLRTRARKFPAIINRTYVDWFHEWPKSALESVSQKFLSEIEILPTQLISSASLYMAYVHSTVNMMSRAFLQNEKRYNYTTPKTFLEFIALYSKLVTTKTVELVNRIERLENGMAKLADCSKQVDILQDQLTIQIATLNAKNEAADKLIVIIGAESEKVQRERMMVYEEERRVRIIEEDISIKTKMCEDDLRKAEPALVAAQAALNTLNKTNLTELKSFGSPPKAVVNVCAAVMVLLAPNGKIPRDRGWRAAKLMMGKVDQFLNDLLNYDKDNIPPNVIEVLEEYLKDPEFNPEKVVQKSVAAAGLCAWIINLHKYHQVFQIVGPKQHALESSQMELNDARERLKFLKGKIDELEQKLSAIQCEFEGALNEKQKCQKVADKTSATISLAHRLVNGLANENVRWKELIYSLRERISTLPGDVLLISSFLSYVGCFTRAYRQELYGRMWIPMFKNIEPSIPHTAEVDPLKLICDEAQIAIWHNEGLPRDQMSTENAAILTNSSRWALMVDPQLQGMKWIKRKYGDDLVILRLTQKGYLDTLEASMARGDTVLIEYIEESIDPILEPLLSRTLIKRGLFIKIGDKEMDYSSNFKLILHTKLANPHFKPEIQAHTTLINFTVTREGLEDQLLAEVIRAERADLEEMKNQVTIQQNTFRITLKSLEDELLACLATARKNVLEDHSLVENLEATKRTVTEIEIKVSEAKTATKKIDESRNHYRPAALRASILYFVLTDLQKINPIYVFSLKSFVTVFKRAISTTYEQRNLKERVEYLVKCITYEIFQYTLRGLFERDKLTFVSHMILQILMHSEQIPKEEMDFLFRYPYDQNAISPLPFVSNAAWGGIRSLAMIEPFYGLDTDMEEFPRRWKQYIESEYAEKMQLPGEWKNRTPLQKLCIIRCLRPERICHFMKAFTEEILGPEYGVYRRINFQDTFKESNAAIPIFFVLSPGVNPLADVEKLGAAMNMTIDNGTFHNISLGQDQEELAERVLKISIESGHWVALQNIHLVANWLSRLEKLVESFSENVNPEFRLFITAEPAPYHECHIIPRGILEPSLKIVEEPPSGIGANFHKALDNFSYETFEECSHESEMKAILFSLCYFHAVVAERRKFETLGWNNTYPFNYGDLVISADILRNYLNESNQVPWEDLRYLFGEIIYGGHITDNWDRRLCQTYLEEIMQQDLVDGDFYLCPGFPAPPNMDFARYHEYIDENLPEETPTLYGLCANAEIALLHSGSENLLKTLLELQPRESNIHSSSHQPREEIVRIIVADTLDKLQDEFCMTEITSKVTKVTPYVVVALQECERMNILMKEMRRSLKELLLSLKGELAMTAEMETLLDALFYGNVPRKWEKYAYPSLLPFHQWFADLTLRIKELQGWCSDFVLPSSIWLGGFFNPQSLLTAIRQEAARRNKLPLDNMCLTTEVTKKFRDDVNSAPLDGAFINGLFLEGADWDCNLDSIVNLSPRELYSLMPVIHAKAVVQEKTDTDGVYQCPVYKTRIRGQTFVAAFDLKTRDRPSKWILGGVALLLQV
ncbi:unnamed protein product [Hermetia illucens]|uniref:Dynein beta chain, ciliary n=1 Tax=Hermetia illucens TaxID=343691 RepID=A0A7R8UQD0_HERIL|nr:dynein beta chain, ciliary isoform X2 [Hermetia illucens]CAD7085079.1 unnamed protein product [Hermetia illucens]